MKWYTNELGKRKKEKRKHIKVIDSGKEKKYSKKIIPRFFTTDFIFACQANVINGTSLVITTAALILEPNRENGRKEHLL